MTRNLAKQNDHRARPGKACGRRLAQTRGCGPRSLATVSAERRRLPGIPCRALARVMNHASSRWRSRKRTRKFGTASPGGKQTVCRSGSLHLLPFSAGQRAFSGGPTVLRARPSSTTAFSARRVRAPGDVGAYPSRTRPGESAAVCDGRVSSRDGSEPKKKWRCTVCPSC